MLNTCMKKLICPVCEKEFSTKQQKQTCCCRGCANTSRMNSKPKRYCNHCEKEIFNRPRCWIRHTTAFCNKECEGNYRKQRIQGQCSVCETPIEFTEGRKRVVCSKECMKIHLRKSYMTREFTIRRSFTEVFLLYMLSNNFPSYSYLPNDRIILEGFEIDIYIPELKVGIECSGPHHFLPINGENELDKIQKRDRMKRGLAYKKGISIITLKYLTSHSKTTKTKLLHLFSELCISLNLTPLSMEVNMKQIDALYRSS